MVAGHDDVAVLVRELEKMRERGIELTRVESQLVWRYRSTFDFYAKATLPGAVKNRIRRATVDDMTIAHTNALRENARRDAEARWREEHAAVMAQLRERGSAPVPPPVPVAPPGAPIIPQVEPAF